MIGVPLARLSLCKWRQDTVINVLIVDDNRPAAELNRLYVNHVRGFNCSGIASSLIQAKCFLAQDEHKVDLVLLNQNIPHPREVSLLSELCGENDHVHIMLISSRENYHAFNKKNEPYAHRMIDCLLAPFQFTRLEHNLSAYRERLAVYRQWANDKPTLIPTTSRALPKGLTSATLSIVCAWIKSNQDQAFSTKMLANAIGISCVSCRKYLLYLSEKQMLTTQFHYGTSGRPMYMYRLLSNYAL